MTDHQLLTYERDRVAMLESSDPGTIKLATAYYHIGCELTANGDYGEAESLLEKAIKMYRHKARKSTKLALAYRALAFVYLKQTKIDHARKCMAKVIKILERKQPISIDLATAYFALAETSFFQEDYHEAQRCLEKAATIYESELPQSFDLANLYYFNGKISALGGSPGEAKRWFEKALGIPKLEAFSLVFVAEISARLANFTHDDVEARKYFEKALGVANDFEGRHGNETLAAVYTNLGYFMQRHGDLQLARLFYQKAFKIDERAEPIAVDSAEDCSHLGMVFYELGEFHEARRWYRQALNRCARTVRTEHRSLCLAILAYVAANSHFGMGRIFHDEGDYVASLEHFEQAHQLYQQFGAQRLESFHGMDPRPLPTSAGIDSRIKSNPIHILPQHDGFLPATWCNVLAKFHDDVQAFFYMLREQPHLVESSERHQHHANPVKSTVVDGIGATR